MSLLVKFVSSKTTRNRRHSDPSGKDYYNLCCSEFASSFRGGILSIAQNGPSLQGTSLLFFPILNVFP